MAATYAPSVVEAGFVVVASPVLPEKVTFCFTWAPDGAIKTDIYARRACATFHFTIQNYYEITILGKLCASTGVFGLYCIFAQSGEFAAEHG